MSAPLIAVPAYRLPNGRVTRWWEGAIAAPEKYADAVFRAGGRPAMLASPDPGPPEEVLSRFDGLLLLGGGDVDPFLYDTEPHERLYGVNRERDLLEMSLCTAAASMAIPTLAICRGIQIANVAFGGSLHQHLPDLGITDHGLPQEDDGYAKHEVTIDEGSRLAGICGAGRIGVNSSHHQAVDRIGDGLTPVARSDDSLVEALERSDGWFVAVQWHPEQTAPDESSQQGLFDELVRRAGARATGSG